MNSEILKCDDTVCSSNYPTLEAVNPFKDLKNCSIQGIPLVNCLDPF